MRAMRVVGYAAGVLALSGCALVLGIEEQTYEGAGASGGAGGATTGSGGAGGASASTSSAGGAGGISTSTSGVGGAGGVSTSTNTGGTGGTGGTSTSTTGTGGTGGASTSTSSAGGAGGGTGGVGGGMGGTGGKGLPPSCEDNATQADCGPDANESCCISLLVPGGTVQLANMHKATVSDFKLDKYEVTVGRFRSFVDAWVAGWRPSAGEGKHKHLNGGSGLSDGASGFEPGWDKAWSTSLGATKSAWDSNLSCDGSYQTWTSGAGSNEKRPINCATWYEQYAFCIWDGGFLPSEAEWQYAAAGGSENRKYSWGDTEPGANADLAVYGCYWNGSGCTGVTNIAPVGSVAAGNGKWGHSDLTGNVWEWTLDWVKAPYSLSHSTDYANVTPSSARVVRGGSFVNDDALSLLASHRGNYSPSKGSRGIGARCARMPQ